ncbi:nitroreductase family protein [Roseibaca calidilacus]|uniref:Nitroreductase n=1 Tax=Roseibaca calidilacus TaxID=1666912 RepID=A0ABM9VQU9_9RHOB|nr:nitroreductase family protein [Roseibaca calidilacus]CUX79991.1 Nitroreductase [Roseibaca calidilacus]
MTDILEHILSRRSVGPRHLSGPDLTPAELAVLATAAAAAPDHGGLCPLHLVHVPSCQRAALAEVFATAALEADPAIDAATLQSARDRALVGPCLIAVLARITPDHPVIPVEEQWISVGAGLQNLLLAALSLELHAKPLSGKRMRSTALREAFHLSADTHLAAFVVLGRHNGPRTERPRRKALEILQTWCPD